jgi:DNA-binding MarR family transcriptional regulator
MHIQPLAAALYESICSMHRRNRTVSSAYDTPLGVLESSVLPEIEANPGIALVEIKTRLHLDQVSTTRLIQGLLKDGIVSQEKSKTDKRFKEIRLTAKGRRLFDTAYQRAVATFNAAAERLSRADRNQFLELFEKFNDALQAAPAAKLPHDAFAMTEIRRISRRLGLMGRSIFGQADCSAIEWHTFDILAQPEATAYVVDLAEMLGCPAKTLAALVVRLMRRGLVKQTVDQHDKRFRSISLTAAGRTLHKKRRAAAEDLLAKGLLGIPTADRRTFVDLFHQYTGTHLAEAGTVVASSLLLQKISDPEQYPELRGFVYHERVRQGLTDTRSADLLGSSAISYVVWSNDSIVAVASFVRTFQRSAWRISHFIWSSSATNAGVQGTTIAKILDQLAVLTGCSAILAEDSEISPSVRDELRKVSPVKILPSL